MAPGELDEYYGFWSSGQSGEMRILGLPSMRELMRVPVFNRCSASGWGQTNESRRVLTEGLLPETKNISPAAAAPGNNGDLHHPHMSFTDGTYDGRYLFMNDKANTRVARVRCDVMKCDKIIEIPNASDIHGLRPQKYPRTGYVFANGEHRVPIPNDGSILDEPEKYHAIFTAIDGDSMDGGLAGHGGRQPGQLRCGLPGAVCVLDLLQQRGSGQPGRDDVLGAGLGGGLRYQAHRGGRQEGRLRDDRRRAGAGRAQGFGLHALHPVSNSPHGCNTAPDGRHVVINGKLSPTVTVLDVTRLPDLFNDKIGPRDVVVAEPQLGLGPLHTAFDGKGNCLYHAVPRQPGREVGHAERRSMPMPARMSTRFSTRSTCSISPATTTARWARRKRRTASGWCH